MLGHVFGLVTLCCVHTCHCSLMLMSVSATRKIDSVVSVLALASFDLNSCERACTDHPSILPLSVCAVPFWLSSKAQDTTAFWLSLLMWVAGF